MSTCLIENYVMTFKDHPGEYAIVFYTNPQLCNLNCYKCHNKLKSKSKSFKFISENEFRDKLRKAKMLGSSLVIICGGEPTLVNFNELVKVLQIIKEFGFKVRLDSNGQNLEVIKKLVLEKLVDGFAIDVKIPLSVYKEHYSLILFSEAGKEDKVKLYQKNLKETLRFLSCFSLPYTLLRTVKYPLFDNEDLFLIKQDILKFNLKHYINEFVDLEE